MESAAVIGAVKAIQGPLQLLALINLTGFLWPKQANVKNCSSFDYIIVGAGTAGSVLANRLTEDPDTTVLLIEAGGDPPLEALLPTLFVTEPGQPYDWDFSSTLNTSSASDGNVKIKLTSGKMLGGSSSLDHFIFNRGKPADYDGWAKITNDPSWKFENVLKYFKKSESMRDKEIIETYPEFHGTNGPTGITKERFESTIRYFNSFQEIGNRLTIDLNTDNPFGYTLGLLTIAKGIRQSTAFSYLTPIRNRTNLFVYKKTTVRKILFNKKKAVGVKVLNEKKEELVFNAYKEIIVSAGVFNTPKLLMNSGIGPKEYLESRNITVRANLPVGDNVQDHVATTLVFKMEKTLLISQLPTLTRLPFPVILGTFTSQNKTAYGQVYNLILSSNTPFLLLSCTIIFGLKNEICDQFSKETTFRNTMYSVLANVNPFSRGKIRLNEKDVYGDPSIEIGYYEDPRDAEAMADLIEELIKVENTTYFTEVESELARLEFPECDSFIYKSRDYFRCYAKKTAGSTYHVTSSCSMGMVVDSDLTVIGFKRLRVVDASVMPKIVKGTPKAAVLMIAEKLADVIKKNGKWLTDQRCNCCR